MQILNKKEIENLLRFLSTYKIVWGKKEFLQSKLEKKFGSEKARIYLDYLIANGYIQYGLNKNFEVTWQINEEFLAKSLALLRNPPKSSSLDSLIKKYKEKQET